MFSCAHEIFMKEEARKERRDELRRLIVEHTKNHLPKVTDYGDWQNYRAPERILENLSRVHGVDSVEALEMHLGFLQSLQREVGYFDLNEFIQITGRKNVSSTLSPVFLYKAYLTIEGFEGAYDVRQGALGLNAYPHLEDVINGDDGETVALALLKAALVLGSQGFAYGFTTTATFPLDGDVDHLGYSLKDPALASMVAHHPERVDEIVGVLLARGSFPGEEAVLEIINSDTKALSAGVL